ncbi:hypothetical protein JXJ21_08590 [candidate division KSB1 bacterium]|nr:hypothetical protein [candidate division KSB1 bacterium]
MTRRERLRRCYFHEELDRPAVYSRTGFPPNDPGYDQLRAYLSEYTELKHGWDSSRVEFEIPPGIKTEPYSEDFRKKITILHTPKGDLQATHFVGLKNQPGMHETFFLKDRADAEKYLSLSLPELSGDTSSFFELDAQLGDAGIVDVSLGFNPAGHVAELFGSEMFAIMSVTDRDMIDALCQRRMKILINRLKFLLSRKVGPYFSMLGQEYIVPPLHGPADFYAFNVKYDKPIIDLVHEAGGRIHIHCHGSIKDIFQGFIDMGADVLHPFEPPPQGNITAREAKHLARDKLCLEGNIQIHRMYDASPEDIRQETEQLIRDTFDDHKGLIVCPSASPYLPGQGEACFPQYKAMIDTVLEWGS